MKTHRRAFTLIELLVVLAVITLLVALLLPTLTAAKKAARIAICGSQLRQHGVAMNAYQVDCAGYYPLFGGTPVPDFLGSPMRIVSHGDGSAGNNDGSGTFSYDPDRYNAFGSYLGLNTTAAGVAPMQSTAPIKYCPLVNWFEFGIYTFANPFFSQWGNGTPGYSYYTGRMMNGSTQTNFNTIKRRDDPREILATDMTMEAVEVGSFGFTSIAGINTLAAPAGSSQTTPPGSVPWFNPHVDRSCITQPSGSTNELAADGHVVDLPFTGRWYLCVFDAYAYFEGTITGGDPNNGVLGSPWGPGPPCEAYAITP